MSGWIMPVVQGAAKAYQTADDLKQNFRQQTQTALNVMEYDKSVLSSAAQTIGRLNVERAGLYKQVTASLAYLNTKKMQAKAATAAGLGATDTVGASADAAMRDADVQASTARANILYNLDAQDYQISTRQSDVLTGASRSLKGGQLSDVLGKGEAARLVFKGFISGFAGAGGGSSLIPKNNTAQSSPPSTTYSWQSTGARDYDSMNTYDQQYADQGESTQGWR